MNPKCHVLIPDGDSTWALTVIRCLSHNPDYKMFVLSNSKRTAARYSRHISHYSYHQRSTDKAWLQTISEAVKKFEISVIVPIAEEEIRFMIQNQQFLSNEVKVIPLPELHSFDTAIYKHKLSQFLKDNNLPHPKYRYYVDVKRFSKDTFELHFPILMKPLHDKGGDGILKFENENSLVEFLQEHQNLDEVFFQEFIDGYDIDCSVLCLEGDILTYTIQKGKMNGDTPFAPQLCFDFLQNEALLTTITKFMKALDWSGVAHIDLRYDNASNTYKIIEVNARFWGSVEASKVAGINFPDLAVKMAMNNRIDKQEYLPIEYMRLKGVLKTLRRKPLFIFNWKYLSNNSEAIAFLKDPAPTFFRFSEWLGRRFSS